MGSSTWLDIIGSLTTFGFLLLSTLRLNASASENNYSYMQNYLLQRNMIVLTAMLEDDLKHVGVGVYDQNGGIQYADSIRLQFRADLPPENGVIDVVEWKFESGSTGLPPNTPNTRIRYLDRIVNGNVTRMNFGVTQFTINYWSVYDPTTPVATPVTFSSVPNTGNIGPISVTIRLESPFKMHQDFMNDTSQYDMVWRQIRSVSRNNSIQFQ